MIKKENVSLSIIFLCHNNRNIDICIDSVLEQMKQYDEIIVVDDHSEQQYMTILNKYSSKNLIKLLQSERYANRSYNRNLGAQMAKNDVLVFLDGDMVIGNYALDNLRTAHRTRSEVAFIGQKHMINYDEIQLQLVSKIDNYLNMLKTFDGKSLLEDNPLFKDPRKEFFDSFDNHKFYWTYYYTGLCSIEREIFELLDGFDESFDSWGSEDVDLGYRISQQYLIGFVYNFHGFHIPHKRNVIQNEQTNRKNIQYMQKKFKTWEFEILNSFYGYGNLAMFNKVLQQMRLINVEEPQITLNKNELLIDIVSQRHPYGNIYYFLDKKIIVDDSTFGTSILQPNKSFHTAFISDHIFIYPNLLACRIIQETLRLAKKVFIYPTNDNIRIPWEKENILLPKVQRQHYQYEVNDIFAYSFEVIDKYIQVLPESPLII